MGARGTWPRRDRDSHEADFRDKNIASQVPTLCAGGLGSCRILAVNWECRLFPRPQ